MAEASSKLHALYGKVRAQLDHLIELAGRPELHEVGAPRVSEWTVGKQLEHLMLSDKSILDRFDKLMDGRETRAPGGRTLLGRVILTLGFIPRGAAKAPEFVVPAGRDAAGVEADLHRLRQRLQGLSEHLPLLKESGWKFRHPYFGALDAAQWLRFMDVHHRHHLRIVRDIRKAAGPS